MFYSLYFVLYLYPANKIMFVKKQNSQDYVFGAF